MHPFASFLLAMDVDRPHRLTPAEARRALWARPDAPPLPPAEPLPTRPVRIALSFRRALSRPSGAY
jgi:hypothetical protein